MSALSPHIVGIRHLSPAGAVHLARVLDRVNPTAVIVEAPAGIESDMRPLVHADTKPPVAILAYTRTRPVRTLVYPLASYSPEWVACRWAVAHERELVFMDLPAGVFLALDAEAERPADLPDEDAPLESKQRYADPLEAFAARAGGTDLDTWWERSFEHTTDDDVYIRTAFAMGVGLRELTTDDPRRARENELREAFMRRQIRATLGKGHARASTVVVCGAFHAPVLTEAEHAMTDEEAGALVRCEAAVTLMPYSYRRLHTRSGYGAGNRAPAYFEALHAQLALGHPERLASRFLTKVVRKMRRLDLPRATAQVIDAARLAETLAAMSDSAVVTLRDLRDAAVTCLGEGELTPLAEAFDQIETGDRIGRLPAGVSRTALQDDFRRQLATLKLEAIVSEKDERLELDLRENRRVKSEQAAFLDRNRSFFLHRLDVCGLPLARLEPSKQAQASWREVWHLRWTPELEVRVAELSLQGDSIAEVATLFLSERLSASTGAGDAAEVLCHAVRCQLTDALEDARARVQAAATVDDSLPSLARAVDRLSSLARFGGIRAVDPTPLWPLVEQLFLRCSLLLPTAVRCDAQAQGQVRVALVALSEVATQEAERLPVPRFDDAMREVALSDGGNPFLAGVACSLLLGRMRLSDEQLAQAFGRRLSPGEDVELAAGFFEGMTAHNPMALFSRAIVWTKLSDFVDALDGRELLRALVPLRRAFAGFAPAEVRRVVSALNEVWQGGAAGLAQALETKLSSDEASSLNAQLDDLDL